MFRPTSFEFPPPVQHVKSRLKQASGCWMARRRAEEMGGGGQRFSPEVVGQSLYVMHVGEGELGDQVNQTVTC